MSSTTPRTLLGLLVERDERTYDEIIAAYLRCARDNGEAATLSPRTFRRWINGQVSTAPRPTQSRVARLFWGHGMRELLAPAALLPSVHAEPRRVENVDSDDPRSRPEGESLERILEMSSRRAARFAATAETTNIGPEAVDQLRDDIAQLALDYLHKPLVMIIGDLVETQEAVFSLLEGRQRPGQTRDLYLLAGMVSGLMAKTSQDLGRMHDAMTQARTLYVCAENAGHSPLRAWARGLQSLISYWAGAPQKAIDYARAGSEIAADTAGSVGGWLAALEARAWSVLPGSAAETLDAIARVDDRRATLSPDDLDSVGGLFTFDIAKEHYYTAGALASLEDRERDAEIRATRAIEMYESGGDDVVYSFSSEAGARAELALARVRAGAADGAAEALSSVFDLEPHRRIKGIVVSTERVHDALLAHRYAGSGVARDLRGQIEAFGNLTAAINA